VFYTGPLDELFDFKFGPIKYRKVRFELEKHNTSSYQPVSQVNYPNSEAFTRITEGNKFLFINNSTTTIMKEYASWDEGFGAYPLQTDENTAVVQRYLEEAKNNDRIILVGRLAECRYYNMDQAVRRGLDVAKELLENR
jgi:UDP-galactopyranose mutase